MQDHITRTRLAGEPPHVMLVPRLHSIGLMEFNRAEPEARGPEKHEKTRHWSGAPPAMIGLPRRRGAAGLSWRGASSLRGNRMPTSIRLPLAGLAALVLAGLVLPARAAPIDGPRFEAVLVAARGYAEERTLLFHCFRATAEARPVLFFQMHGDLQDAIKKLNEAGSDRRQNGRFVEAVWTNVRAAPPDARDAALDAQCASRKLEEELSTLTGVGYPLYLRPAFKALASP